MGDFIPIQNVIGNFKNNTSLPQQKKRGTMKFTIGSFFLWMGIFMGLMLGLLYLLGVFGTSQDAGLGFFVFGALSVVIMGIGITLSIREKRLARKNQALAMDLMTNGMPAKARITFVDKNYSVLFNQKPVYSIVEYTFSDHTGRQYICKKDTVDSDSVIRSQIRVGDEVDLKYSPLDPNLNMLLVKDLNIMVE